MLFQNPVFVGLIMTSPVWLMAIGTYLRLKFGGKDGILGRLGISLQFLAQITLIIDVLLAVSGTQVWTLLFSSILSLAWVSLLISMAFGVVKGPDSGTSDYGIGDYWGYFIIATILLAALVGGLWLLWQFLLVLGDKFKDITSYLG